MAASSSTYYYMKKKRMAQQKRAAVAYQKHANAVNYAALSASVNANPALSETERSEILQEFRDRARLQDGLANRQLEVADEQVDNMERFIKFGFIIGGVVLVVSTIVIVGLIVADILKKKISGENK